ncbi:Cof-type HAD-IIB family hydrolase [Flavobacterium sp. F-380]|uniref:Cof-type HAD-IIB family hydrolase n=1 Tax=Flavobacterium kayseriense TaxID=2764714 RepID=A0ABR7J8E3_9FLAO|nr:Cof-type HAD-IIB family hydrolase [Flavobacterium kayseriense]MBC5841818.1 Cof-type HAD-IIB family hydrolase [Flavobacterium kayseriense]MBC5848347.1 Cof-type HAD-IIB family hydrolase [Flavobacterium kayseriense]
MNKHIKVIISDLDGTLLNEHHTIGAYTKTVLQEMHEQGYLIIIATGRHHLDAIPIVDTLGFPTYLVTSNGARIHSPDRELLYATNIESEAVKSILSLERSPEITTVLFKETVWQTSKDNPKVNSFQTKMNYIPEIVDFDTLQDYTAIKVFFTHEKHSTLIALRDRIVATHSDLFNHAFSLPHCLEFMDKSVDKSVAISKILEIENLNFNQAISFGDGYNDEEMLKSTAKGLLMNNAPDSLKMKLSHLETIQSNSEDGVAKYLYSNFLKTKNKLKLTNI